MPYKSIQMGPWNFLIRVVLNCFRSLSFFVIILWLQSEVNVWRGLYWKEGISFVFRATLPRANYPDDLFIGSIHNQFDYFSHFNRNNRDSIYDDNKSFNFIS